MRGLRLGVPRAHFGEGLEAETGELMEDVLVRLRKAGAVLVEADLDDIGRLDFDAGFPVALHETVADLNAYLAAHDIPMNYDQLVSKCDSPDVRKMLQGPQGEAAISTEVYRHAKDVLMTFRRAIDPDQRAVGRVFDPGQERGIVGEDGSAP
ncbi:MAG: amidase family protein [Candidatus Binatia bacterium]|nr:amidase family protein [Candidatus Binatia bacterium]